MSRYSEWQKGVVNRNFFVLEELRRRPEIEQVLSIDFLPFTSKQSIRNIIQDLRGARGDVLKEVGTRCRTVQRNFYVYSTSQNVKEAKKILSKIDEVLKKIQAKDLLLWSYNPFIAGAFSHFKSSHSVFDAVDNWQRHPVYENYQEKLKTGYQEINRRAKTIFTVSQSLLSLFFGHPQVRLVPNGVALDLWQTPQSVPLELQMIPTPRIGYIGNIQERVNLDLIQYLAENNLDKHFILIGRVWESTQKKVKQLQKISNIHFIDRVPYAALSAYVQHFDVCLVPHLVNDFTDSMNPMKMYEYLALGKPVISSSLTGFDEFKEVIHLAGAPEEWQHQLNLALVGDGDELKVRRKSLVRNHTWQNRVNDMMRIIYS